MAECGKCGHYNGEMESTCGGCRQSLLSDRSRSRERLERERKDKVWKDKELNTMFDEKQEALFERIAQKAADKAAEQAAELAAEKVCGRAVELAVQKIDEKYGPKFASMDNELKKFEKLLKESRPPPSEAKGLCPRSVSAPADAWRPSKVEVKGFVGEEAWLPGNEEMKEARCKSKQECIEAATTIIGKLPQEVQSLVDISLLSSYSDAYLYGRVDIPIAKAAQPGSAKKVLDAVSQVLALTDIGQGGKPLRASLELKPELKATSRILGRAFGALRRLGADNASMKAAYNPLSIKSLTTGRPTTVATFLDGQWNIVDKGRAQLLPAKSNEEVEQALAQSS